MTAIREWAVVLCTAGIACAFLRMLCPKGALRRTFGMLTALFFFCCLIAPLGTLGAQLGRVFGDVAAQEVPTALEEQTAEQVAAVLEQALVQDAAERLADYGVKVKKAEIVRDMTRLDSIYIERVRLTFAKADYPLDKTAVSTLERAWGMIVEVQYSG